ncbi:hypothetical protein QVD17_40002 [Tagetes erecta]|uniref:Uncharacterized protein n=1 Tax=Tagetes erecta TaxID=13708 RepID=A0AAD8JRJ3_TARER|nr:hypothetical protein QVD17_40002 [Tagetes erecta]
MIQRNIKNTKFQIKIQIISVSFSLSNTHTQTHTKIDQFLKLNFLFTLCSVINGFAIRNLKDRNIIFIPLTNTVIL